MGKYTTTRAFRNDRKRSNSFSSSGDSLYHYFYDVPKDETQFMMQTYLSNIDPTGIYSGSLRTRDVRNFYNDYFRNTGLTWSDVKYPTLMANFGSIGYGSTVRSSLNFVSRNVKRLYG